MTDRINPLGRESERNVPQLEQVDGFGHRVDTVHTSAAWKALARIAAEEVRLFYVINHDNNEKILNFYFDVLC